LALWKRIPAAFLGLLFRLCDANHLELQRR
jgi:hypothetical protein